MDLQSLCRVIFVTAVISLVCHPCSVTAGDIINDDDLAPKKPGCENDFVLVIIGMLLFCFFYPVLVSLFCQLGLLKFLFLIPLYRIW